VEVEELLFRGHPDVVDADLADYFGSIPHTDLPVSGRRNLPLGRRDFGRIQRAIFFSSPIPDRGRPKRLFKLAIAADQLLENAESAKDLHKAVCFCPEYGLVKRKLPIPK
jgi:hypothetical protein